MEIRNVSSAAALMGARAFSMALGLVGIPILLTALGDKRFAAWAVLTGGGLLFYCLELAMPTTLVRYLSRVAPADREKQAVHLHSNAAAVLVCVYGAALAAVLVLAAPAAEWLRLPSTPLLSAGGLIVFVCVATALTSLFKLGLSGLDAAGHFRLVALLAATLSGAANIATWVVAVRWHRLDLVVIAYWGVQLLLTVASSLIALRFTPWGLRVRELRAATMASLVKHGFFLQGSTLVYLAHFQLDKSLISAFAGLSEVARYEVGARPAQALRNLPGGALRIFLPEVARHDLQDARGLYLGMTSATAYGVLVFLLLPLTVAPLFLFAWAGEIGYHGRWVFLWMAIALSVDLLMAPVSSFIQALGRTEMEAGIALRGLAVHLALAALLVGRFGKNGAAAACAVGILAAHATYFARFHRLMKWRVRETLAVVGRELSPGLLVCVAGFALATLLRPWVIVSRWYMAASTVLLYGMALSTLAIIYRERLRVSLAHLRPGGTPGVSVGGISATAVASPTVQ